MSNHGFAMDPNTRALLKDLGIDGASVLRRAGLPLDLLSRWETRLSTPEYVRFWAALEEEVDDPLLPIMIGRAFRSEVFHPAIFAALCSPNLRVACERIARYKPLVAAIELTVDANAHRLELDFDWIDAIGPLPRSMVLSEFTFFVALARIATREEVVLVKAVTDERPEGVDAFRDYLGVDIEVGDRHAIAFSARDAERPFLTRHGGMWQTFEPELRRQLDELDASAATMDRVQTVLLELLPGGESSIDEVAKRLAMSRRTLQRRLSEEATTFQKILDVTREELARHYLDRTALTSAEIAFLLGYDEPNSFSRAFRKWTGSTPEAMRQ